ncbi:coniferyl aldehyde dehydrogenase [Paludibacterium paludis]|uniref:Aldehyde dehydrogenase n=1 Tax=Paludibacterium paludis TaxID=1225769 RepID=A0A918UAU9_9NEIS|nr:coniferyl aldehyde dehydrogenase [Paludibacterium paludis]GGY20717.1 aldehyde dehydrogenase [Paludibacterium paludis]
MDERPDNHEAAMALEPVLERLRAGFAADAFPSAGARKERLRQLRSLVLENRQALIDAVCADFGHRSATETELSELFPTLEEIRYASGRLKGWMTPRRRPVSQWFMPARNRVMPQPLGVIGVVVPWNFPLFLAFGPLVGALAAGNRVMIKMSEFTPRTGALLERLCRHYFGDGLVAVVNGGVDVAEAFTRLPFDHLLFTGSTAVGRHVMRAAAANLTPVTLELGGKSPVIVSRCADLKKTAASLVQGKLLNAGQICVAPDYVLVPHEERAALVAELKSAFAKQYPRRNDNPDYTCIINDRQYRRLADWLEEARTAGADVQRVDPAGEPDTGRKMPLHLVLDCPDSARLMQEEIFGPILPIVGYDSLDEALDYVNRRPRPLALYLFARRQETVDRVLAQTLSGGVAINDTVMQVAQDGLPFGGVGPSGMGHYHGYDGFLTFSKLKPVFVQSRLGMTWMTRAPYGRLSGWLVRLMVGG